MPTPQLWPIPGMDTEPKDFPGSPLLVYPNLGCPQILAFNRENHYVLEGVVIAESQQTIEDVRSFLNTHFFLQLLVPQAGKSIAERVGSVPLVIYALDRWPALPFAHPRFENDGTFNYPRPDLIEIKAFEDRNTFFYIKFTFTLPLDFQKMFQYHTLLLFDIVYHSRTGLKWVNFHSVCISRNDWRDFTFIHASDLHVAKRNDNILPVVLRNIKERVNKSPEEQKKQKEQKEDDYDRSIKDIPIEQRFLNVNDNIRRFCKLANHRVSAQDLDFVIFTGDLIDFVVPASFGESPFRYNLHNSNWETLRAILLGADYNGQEPPNECGELLAPCFTIVGNHDYRLWHYSIHWGFLYRLLGLTTAEAMQYNDPVPANPIGALAHSEKGMAAYYQVFNPWLDYHITLGNNHFLFLDSKWDSILDFRDLLMGSPSLKGFNSDQIRWLQLQAKSLNKGQHNVFICCHAPILNPPVKVKGWEAVKEVFTGKKLPPLPELKESVQNDLPPEQRRIDLTVKLKNGTISRHWSEAMEFCLDYATLVLSGHTHKRFEFRIAPTQHKSSVFEYLPFERRKIPTPAAVFFDEYSEIAPDPWWISEKRPFLVQTPALGPSDYQRNQRAGSFRVIKVRDGKVNSFKVENLHDAV